MRTSSNTLRFALVLSVVSAFLLVAGLLPTPGFLPTPRATAQAGETMIFVVTGLRTDTGTLRGGIYASSDVWTAVGGQVAVCTSRVSGGESRCVVHAPGPGRYAFAFYHDADNDNQLDRDMVGVPQEGYGFSNNARPGLGAPSFESAAFNITPGQVFTTRIAALYGWSL